MELQRIIPSLIALLEYEWLTGKTYIKVEDINRITSSLEQSIDNAEKSELAFWLLKARKQYLAIEKVYEGYDVSNVTKAQKAAALWRKSGCTYSEALVLFEGNEEDKKNALLILLKFGANAVSEKIKMEMRAGGIKKIPRGLRESTKTNPAQLTNRELDIIQLLQKAIHNKEIAETLFISPKTVDHHISSILFKLDVNSRSKAVNEAFRLGILK
ncbi:MAG: helix-turn-helix domain-containing protein [Ginsengibacter sp.]